MEQKDQGCKARVFDLVTGNMFCGKECVGKGLCARHYQQARRGRLGESKTIAAPGEAAEIKVTTGKDLKKRIAKQARQSKLSLSEMAKILIEEALKHRHEG